MSRSTKVVLCIVLVAGFVWWAWSSTRPRPAMEASLRLAWIPGATFAGDYLALERGFWQQEGITMRLQPGGFEYDAIKLVASGADMFGVTSGPQILQARASGVPIVAIGTTIPRSPIGWVSKKASGIVGPADFIGRKVGAQFGTHTEITFEALFAKLNLDINAVERIAVKFDPRPFVVGEIDVLPVYLIDQPVDLESQGIELNYIDPADHGVSLAFGNLYFTTEDVIRTRPELVRAFLAAAVRGWQEAERDRAAAVAAIVTAAPDIDQVVLRRKLDVMFEFIRAGRATYDGVFEMPLAQWQSTRDILVNFGGLGPSAVESAYTNEFVR